MSEQTDVIRQVYSALSRGDRDALAALTDPEVVITQTEALPYGGRFVGREGLRAFVTGVFTALDSSVEVSSIFEAGEKVVQVGRTRGTARGTGERFDSPEVHIWGVRDGRVISLEAYVDTDAVLAALNATAA